MEKRTAVITGSSRGIGRQIAITLAGNGYNIVLNYHQNKAAAEKTAELIAQKTRVMVVQADVSNPAEVDRLFRAAKENFGFVDTLVCNAGIAQGKLLIDHSVSDYSRIMDTNFGGTFFACRSFLPDMLANGFGRIVNISSVFGVRGAAMEVLYSASKAAIIGLTRALAKEVAAMGVTVNAIAPGAIDTDMLHQLSDEVIEQVKGEIGVGRLGDPKDIAAATLFLASKQAEYITGQVLGIDGAY